jgi:hypothetical protein
MVGGGQRESIVQRLVGRKRLGLAEAFAIAAAEDVHRDRELVATEIGVASDLIGVDIDQLDDPVRVCAGGGGDEVNDWLAADAERRCERVRGEGDDVGASGKLALVIDQPAYPGEIGRVADGLAGTGAKRNRFGRVSGAAAAAMRVGFTKTAAIARTEALKSKDFAAVVGSTAEVAAVQSVRQRGIQVYAASRSFDGANSIAQSIILPMTQAFDREEIEEIVRVGFQNGQIRFSHEFSVVLSSLKVNRNVDLSWWDPLLRAQNADDFTYSLYFIPPPPKEDGAAPSGLDDED